MINIKILREGYTKLSFAKKTGISRINLNKILDRDISNEAMFENYINKIMEILNIDIEELVENDYTEAKQNDLNTVYSDDMQQDYQRNEKLDLLDEILDLCEIYIVERELAVYLAKILCEKFYF